LLSLSTGPFAAGADAQRTKINAGDAVGFPGVSGRKGSWWSHVASGVLAALCLCAAVGVAHSADAPAQIAVGKVTEVADPCDVNKQRMKKVGGTVLGAVLGFAACRLAAEAVDKGSTRDRTRASAACAVVGGVVGYNWSADSARRQCELSRVAKENNLNAMFQEVTVKELPVDAAPAPQPSGSNRSNNNRTATNDDKKEEPVIGITTLPGLGHFGVGSAELTPAAQTYFSQIARQYTFEGQRESLQRELAAKKKANALKQENLDALRKEWAEIKVVLIGHTDDTGPDAINASLSERRARAVAEVFRGAGIAADKLFYQGAGSSLPVADNRTEEGRDRNRRVEVVELPPGADVAGYLALRKPNPNFLRPLPEPKPAPAPVVASTPPSSTPPVASTTTPASPPKTAPAPSGTKPPAKPPAKAASDDDWGEPTASTPPKPSAPPAAQKKPPPAASNTLPPLNIDFGGTKATARNDAIAAAMGPPARSGGWGFITSAVAADDALYTVPCVRDSPELNVGLPVKQLGTGQPVYKTNEYLPGFNDAAWRGSVNGHSVALNHVAILRAGNEPVRNPEVRVYKDFDRTGDLKADLTSDTRVKVYEGTSGLLYRVFLPKSRLRCLDVVVPAGGGLDAVAGDLFYERPDGFFTAPYVPGRLRAQ
jgi:outer membrane protein OmpA-like peptidoglycan-associated protein